MPSWVYKIIEKENELCIYVGSSTGKYFCLRKGSHTRPSQTKSGKQPKLYNYIKEKGGFEKFKFEIINEYETIEKSELLTIEKKYIYELNPTCNTLKNPIRTKEENLEIARIKAKKYRDTHPEYIEKMKNSESYIRYQNKRCSTKIDCECGSKYSLQNKTNHFKSNIHNKMMGVEGVSP